MLDPARILPPRADPNSNGHFPFPGQPHGGTQRSFNLSNVPYLGGNNAVPLNGVPMGGFPGFMGVSQGNTWHANGLTTGGTSGLHQPGVMRRGGGRYNNRSGPYDRRGGGRYGNSRITPGRGGSSNSYGGRLPSNQTYIPPGHPAAAAMFESENFPDAVSGGQQGMGPREAVQGRMIKSYEDLDAVGGGGGGELDY